MAKNDTGVNVEATTGATTSSPTASTRAADGDSTVNNSKQTVSAPEPTATGGYANINRKVMLDNLIAENTALKSQNNAPPVDKVEETGTTAENQAIPDASETTENKGPEKKQTAEQGRIFAAMRKSIEKEAADKRAKEMERLNAVISELGFDNDPLTGLPITGLDDLLKISEARKASKTKSELESAGITPDTIAQTVRELPEVKILTELQATMTAEAEEKAKKEFNAAVEKEINEISAYDPRIKSIADLPNMDNFEEFRAHVSRGLSYRDAYRLANFDKISKARTEGATQQAINRVRAQEHIVPVNSGADTANAAVPKNVREYYKKLNPGITDNDIVKKYADYIKNTVRKPEE